MKIVVVCFILYIAYRFVIKIVLPAIALNKQLRAMWRSSQEQHRQAQETSAHKNQAKTPHIFKGGDYVDYEEVK